MKPTINENKFPLVPSCDSLMTVCLDQMSAKEQYEWLHKNQDVIYFEKSYPSIEQIHHVRHQDDLNHLDGLNDYVDYPIQEIKAKLFPFGHPYKFTFDTCRYERYARLDIREGQLEAELVVFDADINEIRYSLPFLRSLIANNQVDNDRLYFSKTTMPSTHAVTVVIKIEVNGNPKYYDYSQQPSK